MKKYFCLCCGYKTLDVQPPGTYEICHICGWEDDYTAEAGSNHVNLKQARENFKKIGISDPDLPPQFIHNVLIKPTKDIERDPNWEGGNKEI